MTPELTLALAMAVAKLRTLGFENVAAVLEHEVNSLDTENRCLRAEIRRLETNQ